MFKGCHCSVVFFPVSTIAMDAKTFYGNKVRRVTTIAEAVEEASNTSGVETIVILPPALETQPLIVTWKMFRTIWKMMNCLKQLGS